MLLDGTRQQRTSVPGGPRAMIEGGRPGVATNDCDASHANVRRTSRSVGEKGGLRRRHTALGIVPIVGPSDDGWLRAMAAGADARLQPWRGRTSASPRTHPSPNAAGKSNTFYSFIAEPAQSVPHRGTPESYGQSWGRRKGGRGLCGRLWHVWATAAAIGGAPGCRRRTWG